MANLGLAGMVAGFIAAPYIGTKSIPLTAGGGTLFALGALVFVYNLWRTFNAADARQRARAAAGGGPRLPTVGD
jgi:cbb3-type cytochrome oxidase subunit 1